MPPSALAIAMGTVQSKAPSGAFFMHPLFATQNTHTKTKANI